ncbi:low-density lipoprotein receptor domain class A domain-containing protein [Phthorimaea operculella]|nr:low-density lipoprotein receptor domain class A domain-containing protein [Phthorimaea operculella]
MVQETLVPRPLLDKAPCANETHLGCANGECLPAEYFCDGSLDCMDNSDEVSIQWSELCMVQETLVPRPLLDKAPCVNETDLGCANGECLPAEYFCDGSLDCMDNSDEVSIQGSKLCIIQETLVPRPLLDKAPCANETHLGCANGECLPAEYFCDGSLDCMDNSDKYNKILRLVFHSDEIQAQLPIAPNDTATVIMKLYGEADFLDLGGVGENLFPNSLNSNYPSRVGSPVPHAQTSLPTQSSNPHTSLSSGFQNRNLSGSFSLNSNYPSRVGSPVPHAQTSLPTQSSNPHTSLSSGFQNRNLSGSFRSTNSHTTNWSAPISVLPPSRGRQIETQIIIRYSGGAGKDMHCRQSNLQINLELLPSVSITHWDVLPAEIPSQLYLVLDVTNLTNEEMDFHYAENKHILIESKESCRVPVPLDRCPFNAPTPKTKEDETLESRSISTGTSTNSLELMCSEHITNNVSLRWHLMQSDISGIASVKGITLSQAMMDIVRMSPLDWEVSVNSQYIKPQEELQCSAGEWISLGVGVSNHLTVPLHKLCLSVQFYQDYNNGVMSYKLENRVATAGNNKVVLPVLPESEKAYHECTVVFLTPGEYKIDIQCSTTEPILDDLSLRESDTPSIIQPPCSEVSHIWRFIPPVAISVSD